MSNTLQEGVAASARDAVACPVMVGDVFTTSEHGEIVRALEIVQRKYSVWSVRVQPVMWDGDDWVPAVFHAQSEWHGLWKAIEVPERWTSVKVYADRHSVDIYYRP